jgi:carboxyl-terminal processing protease
MDKGAALAQNFGVLSRLTRFLDRAATATLGALAGAAFTLASSNSLAAAPQKTSPLRTDHAQTLRAPVLEEILQLLDERYIEPVDLQAALDRAKRALVNELDPYTRIYSADERKALVQSAAKTTGLSLAFQHKRGGSELIVVDVLPESPAARAGIEAGERVLAVDRLPATSFGSNHELELFLATRENQELTLQVQGRKGQRDVSLRLGVIASTKPVDVRALVDGDLIVLHAAIRIFSRGVAAQTLAEIEQHIRRHALAKNLVIVLDVRSNPGGEIEEAILLADHFLSDALIVRLHGRGGIVLRDERSQSQTTDNLSTPIYVLQDRWSASASELLAAALQGNRRAMVIGEQSYGKGSVQEVRELSDGSLLRYSFARYHSPLDLPIDRIGVAPDHHLHVVRSQNQPQPREIAQDAGLRAVVRLYRGQIQPHVHE